MSGNPQEIFQKVGGARLSRSAFNLSYEKKFTCDMGQLIPVLCDECLPGDVWRIGNSAVARFQPLLAPVLHAISMRTYYFFVPYRLLFDDWEDFITRGVTGNTVVVLPLWDPADAAVPADVIAKGTLWDYMGMPTGIQPSPESCPIDMPRRAYIHVWNEFFRDETLQTELDPLDPENFLVLNRCWERDIFTSALTTQQRGTAPALPVFGSASADFDLAAVYNDYAPSDMQNVRIMATEDSDAAAEWGYIRGATAGVGASAMEWVNDSEEAAKLDTIFSDNNTIDGSAFSSVDIADLRLAWQLQVWMERNNRAGYRYIEQLQAHFGVSPRDERLQRPEFIGGTTNDVLISEVLQTGEAGTTPQGNMAGHGIAVQSSEVGRYRVEEFGLVIGLMCIVPKTAYQNGINRQWLRRTTFDFPFPEFTGLSEQEIFNEELICKGIVADPTGVYNRGVFGYTGRYNELRYKPNLVAGDLRDTYAYWHLGRVFDPTTPPALNAAFVECVPRKDIFAVPSEPGLIVSFGNHLDVMRPIPFLAEPSAIGGRP